ncbi:MAG: fluoride efflux transporter CrcB [Deltaproteobacteria bacterium]|nr:fluoride efflux transporter CrcB [Deltaproteobacteria bacterium]
MHKIILIGVGGFIGSILRYLVSGYVQNLSNSISIPYGTFAVNVIGCFLIGMFSHLAELQIGMTLETRLLLIVGLIGSFTTYSTFGNETMTLLQDQRFFLASLNIGAHILAGLSAVLLGRLIINAIWR